MESSASLEITIRYSVKRRELWNWYWWAWRQPRGLWSYWLVLTVLIFVFVLFVEGTLQTISFASLIAPAILTSLLFLFFVVFLQVSYKPRERVLTVGLEGIETRIGDTSARRDWRDISYIVERASYTVICVAGGISLGIIWLRIRNGNAFVIPRRAFDSNADYLYFVNSIESWHKLKSVRFPRFSLTRYYAEN